MCCTPYVATIVAGVLSIFQSFANLTWNVPIIISIGWNNTRLSTITPFDVTLTDNIFEIYGTTLFLAFLNIHLLIFSCLMLKANSALKTDWLLAWCILVTGKSTLSVLLGIYYFYIYSTIPHYSTETYFRLAALYSGVFFFWPAINLVFSAMVFKRYKDIGKSNAMVPRTERTDSQNLCLPPPYTPGSFVPHQQNAVDPAAVTGWSQQPLINFEQDTTAQTDHLR